MPTNDARERFGRMPRKPEAETGSGGPEKNPPRGGIPDAPADGPYRSRVRVPAADPKYADSGRRTLHARTASGAFVVGAHVRELSDSDKALSYPATHVLTAIRVPGLAEKSELQVRTKDGVETFEVLGAVDPYGEPIAEPGRAPRRHPNAGKFLRILARKV